MKRGKKYKKVIDSLKDTKEPKSLEEAIERVKRTSYSAFEGTVEVHISTKSKEKEYSVRGNVSFPHPFGNEKKVLVFCNDKDSKRAIEAGADYAGLTELIKKIDDGLTDFDVVLATPEVMKQIAVLGRVLGPKGLMPNPKSGTVITNFDQIRGFKIGKTTFKTDDTGVIHSQIGKIGMETAKLIENLKTLVATVREACTKSKATIKTIFIAPTMGPSVQIPSSLI